MARDVTGGHGIVEVAAVPYLEHSHVAQAVLGVGIAAFIVGEVAPMLRPRRGVPFSSVLGEALFRLMFVAGIREG